ncbi:MAG: hypothetical protein ABFC34_09270 [Methanobacterium sp.]
MNKISKKQSEKQKKNYNTPLISVHGDLSKVTKGTIITPDANDEYGCS